MRDYQFYLHDLERWVPVAAMTDRALRETLHFLGRGLVAVRAGSPNGEVSDEALSERIRIEFVARSLVGS